MLSPRTRKARHFVRRAILGVATVLWVGSRAPTLAADSGYKMWFNAHVLSVDARRGELRIVHGPNETSGYGIETCSLSRAALASVRPGMEVLVQVDSRRHPWRLLHLREITRQGQLKARRDRTFV